ncbi:hypothetical protein PPNSA23_10190 [Phyllobacterium phragmitis]|uniref:LysR substrate-binding domain-containing protein n=1 Tax=Phyllobacterium phragmitis TaxID=2670329 RepID=A0ABQ0GWM2_9HYPH
MVPHLGKRLPADIWRRGLGIERITRKQDGRRALFPRVLREPPDSHVPCLTQSARQVAREIAEAFSQM